jgi:YggT family protein
MVAATSAFQRLICVALTVAWIILLARVVLSWLEFFGVRRPITGPLRTLWDLLFDVTEPIVRPLRRIVPPAGMFDLSIVVAFVVIFVLQRVFC